MKRLIPILLLLLSVILLFPSCQDTPDSLVGTWVQVGESRTYIFREDGSGRHHHGLHRVDITYEMQGERITVYDKTLFGAEDATVYFFELDGDTLKLTDGEATMVFARQPID